MNIEITFPSVYMLYTTDHSSKCQRNRLSVRWHFTSYLSSPAMLWPPLGKAIWNTGSVHSLSQLSQLPPLCNCSLKLAEVPFLSREWTAQSLRSQVWLPTHWDQRAYSSQIYSARVWLLYCTSSGKCSDFFFSKVCLFFPHKHVMGKLAQVSQVNTDGSVAVS